jgi:hypothetical protein
MPFLENFERRGLFGFTRLLALSIVAVLILGLIGGAIFFGSTLIQGSDRRVEPNKVVAAILPVPAQATDGTSTPSRNEGGSPNFGSLPGLKVPFSLQPYFSQT